MKSKDLERKLKIEGVETCLNCKLFTGCDDIGRFEECADFNEVDCERGMIIVRVDEYYKLESIRR